MRRFRLILAIAVILSCVLSIGHSLTRRPWNDEGAMAAPPLDLLHRGSLGTTVWEMAGADQPDGNGQAKGVHKHTYYVPPLYFLSQALWYTVVPATLLGMRAHSMVWGLLLLAAVGVSVRRITSSPALAVTAVSLLALDYVFLISSSFGRMDMMSAALGWWGVTAFLLLREKHLPLAVVTANSLAAASMLTHPLGAVHVVGVLIVALYYDRPRATARLILLGAAPYLLGGACYGWYIAQSPEDFITQFRANAVIGDRLLAFRAPWLALWREAAERYGSSYGLRAHSAGNTGPIVLKGLILLGYVTALLGCLLSKEIRQRPGSRLLLLLFGSYWVVIGLIDSTKNTFYLIHIMPLFAILLSLFLEWLMAPAGRLGRNRVVQLAVMASVAGFVGLQAGGIAYKIKLNTYRNTYLEAVRYLKDHMRPGSFVLGSADLAFELGFEGERFIDDTRLGYFSGRTPEFIVVEEVYEITFAGHRLHRPAVHVFVKKLLAEDYALVYDRNFYKIYRRKNAVSAN